MGTVFNSVPLKILTRVITEVIKIIKKHIKISNLLNSNKRETLLHCGPFCHFRYLKRKQSNPAWQELVFGVQHIRHPRPGRMDGLLSFPQPPATVTRSRPDHSARVATGSPSAIHGPLRRGRATGQTLGDLSTARWAPAGMRPVAFPRQPPGSSRAPTVASEPRGPPAEIPARRPLHSQRPRETARR